MTREPVSITARLLAPGLWVLRRLRMRGKLALVACILLVPLLWASAELQWGYWQQVQAVHAERAALPPAATAAVVQALDNRETALQWRRALGAATGATVFGLLIYLALCVRHSFVADFGRLLAAMRGMAGGRLDAVQPAPGRDEIAEMSRLLADLTGSLAGIVADVRSNAALVAQAGHVLASGHRDLATRTEQQAANLEQTSASVQQLASTVQQNAASASEVDQQTGQVREAAERGADSMGHAVGAVEAIQSSAHRMAEITGTIDALAFQTNILALNAAVEAARAGEQGRGFAVVAAEVRRLAQRSGEAAKEIRQLIETSLGQVDNSVQRIRSAGGGIAQIVDGVRGVAANMSSISRASAEQSSGLQQLSQAVTQLDGLTQRNAQLVDEAVVQAGRLEERARTLSQAVVHFRLPQGTADEAYALVQRALAQHGRMQEKAFLEWLTQAGNGCHDRDMYVFALDGAGTYCGFAGNAAKVGARVHDIPGVDGARLLQTIVAQAETEPGWVEYDIVNPATGAVQVKMSYVAKRGNLYLGCGVYKSVGVRQAA